MEDRLEGGKGKEDWKERLLLRGQEEEEDW